MADKIWFITGASRGFGRVWAEAALRRGDKVTATARHLDDLQGLVDAYGDRVLPLVLDVTDRAAAFATVARAHAHFGRLDVVINNAGYGLFGTVEELSEVEARAQIDTNVLGVLWVIQAALPIMRAQGRGHLLTVSSVGGLLSFPARSLYCASKWAIEALNEALAAEVEGFGIKVTLIEPASYATDWAGSSAMRATEMPAYDAVRRARDEANAALTRGEPQATGDAILTVVDAPEPPLRLLLGADGLSFIRKTYDARIAEWTAWQPVSSSAQ